MIRANGKTDNDGILLSTSLKIRPWVKPSINASLPEPARYVFELCCGPPLAFFCNETNDLVWAVVFNEEKHIDVVFDFVAGKIPRKDIQNQLAAGIVLVPESSELPLLTLLPCKTEEKSSICANERDYINISPAANANTFSIGTPATHLLYPVMPDTSTLSALIANRFQSMQAAPGFLNQITPRSYANSAFLPQPTPRSFVNSTFLPQSTPRSYAFLPTAQNVPPSRSNMPFPSLNTPYQPFGSLNTPYQPFGSSFAQKPAALGVQSVTPEEEEKKTRRRKTDVLPVFLSRTDADEAIDRTCSMLKDAKKAESTETIVTLNKNLRKLEQMPPIHHLNSLQLRRGYYKTYLGQYGVRPTCASTNFGAFLRKLCLSVKGQSSYQYREARLPSDPDARAHFDTSRQPLLVKNGLKRKWLKIGAYYPVIEADSFNNLNIVKLYLWVRFFYLILQVKYF